MVKEVLALMQPRSGGVFVDLTAGLGGHSREILQNLAPEKLIAVDRDVRNREALAELKHSWPQTELRFQNFVEAVQDLPANSADAVLVDLGYHSGQLETVSGLAYLGQGNLDMRLSEGQGVSASDLLKRMDEKELAYLFRTFGEEPKAWELAKYIKRNLPQTETIGTAWLVATIERFDPNPPRARQKMKRVFQALRIAVNDELENLRQLMEGVPKVLKAGARLVVLTFHSLEDRLVKNTFKEWAAQGLGQILTRKAIKPSEEEIQKNSRAASALCRAFEKSAQDQGGPQ